MATVSFAKYHGLGNDFLVIDLRDSSADLAAAVQDPLFVQAACDRQFGVGGDGILAILPAVTAAANARMRVLNADGSEAEMCGNGLRCVAKYLYERGGQKKPTITVDTGAGALSCALQIDNGIVVSVTVDMGRPRLQQAEIPMLINGEPSQAHCIEMAVPVAGQHLNVTAVSMGNPHAIVFVESRAQANAMARSIGPSVETHPWFPKRTNSEFAFVRPTGDIDLIVWERGCGITLACGTGACATVVAACLTGRSQVGRPVAVHLLGGSLTITVDADYATVFMQGPAVHSFDGVIDIGNALRNARPVS
jgi:diaminopimelate epimerase